MNEIDTMQCNICGKMFDEWDMQQNFKIDVTGMFGSKHDGESIKCRMCCECLDNLIDEYILPKSTIDVVVAEEW